MKEERYQEIIGSLMRDFVRAIRNEALKEASLLCDRKANRVGSSNADDKAYAKGCIDCSYIIACLIPQEPTG